jgi:hypothetical protein
MPALTRCTLHFHPFNFDGVILQAFASTQLLLVRLTGGEGVQVFGLAGAFARIIKMILTGPETHHQVFSNSGMSLKGPDFR